jgi:hypothetical protein
MALNLKFSVYRGPLATIPATTGQAGVLFWTTDSDELFIDTGTVVQRLAAGNQVFNETDVAALTSLPARIGDICVIYTGSPLTYSATYMMTAFPSTSAGNWQLIASASADSGVDLVSLPGATAHNFVTYIDSNGVQHLAQPSFSDISGNIAQTQLPASIGPGSSLTIIDCGTW